MSTRCYAFETQRLLTGALSGVTAAIVGVILNLALVFGAAVIFHDGSINRFAVVITVLAFIALFRIKIDVLRSCSQAECSEF